MSLESATYEAECLAFVKSILVDPDPDNPEDAGKPPAALGQAAMLAAGLGRWDGWHPVNADIDAPALTTDVAAPSGAGRYELKLTPTPRFGGLVQVDGYVELTLFIESPDDELWARLAGTCRQAFEGSDTGEAPLTFTTLWPSVIHNRDGDHTPYVVRIGCSG